MNFFPRWFLGKAQSSCDLRHGFSMLELMFGLLLAGLASWLAFLALRAETRLSNRVQARAEVTQEARTILQWVREDLKLCCQPLSGGRFRPSLMESLERGTEAGGEWYSFLRFSRRIPFDEAAPSKRFGKSIRQASRVTWRLVVRPGVPVDEGMALERVGETDLASGAAVLRASGIPRRLSERVLAFSIRPQVLGKNGDQIQVFRVMLRLRAGDSGSGKAETGKAASAAAGGEEVSLGAKASFEVFDVISPDFFESIWGQHGIRHPWHTVIAGP